jgi:hypothetical protein
MTTRTIVLTAILLAALPASSAAGQTPARPAPTRPEPSPAPIAPADERNARDTKERLREIFDQYPPSVAQVLRLDPSLLTRPDYLALYPTLATFLSQHPEVAHNPVFYLGGSGGGQPYPDGRVGVAHAIESIFIGLEVMIGVMFGIGALAWLVRSAIDHRRWLRAVKIQTEAHTKIVDRLSSNEDLLNYMQSATGQRFLTATLGVPPIGDAAPQIVGAPFNRILWSVQAGIVLAAAGFGLWFAKNGIVEEVAQSLQVVAILAIALGIGFIASAFASYAMSRQLGLVQAPVPHA